jgi:hypothetical protein
VCLRDGCSTNSVLEVSVTINTDRDGPINLTVPSHPYAVLDSQPRTISLELDRNKVRAWGCTRCSWPARARLAPGMHMAGLWLPAPHDCAGTHRRAAR